MNVNEGAQAFADQLRSIGIQSSIKHQTWVEFDYVVEGGKFAGTSVKMAINVPNNFPATPPSGINFSPRLMPQNTSAQHPQRSHPCRHPDWKANGEYWSRPHSTWNSEGNKNAQTYMAFVRQLWGDVV